MRQRCSTEIQGEYRSHTRIDRSRGGICGRKEWQKIKQTVNKTMIEKKIDSYQDKKKELGISGTEVTEKQREVHRVHRK